MQIGNLIIRPFQLFFVAVVLGLSIELVKEQYQYSVPNVTNVAVASGVVGAIALLIGIGAVFISSLQGVVLTFLDALALGMFLGTSVSMAVQLGVHSCTDRPSWWNKRARELSDKNQPFMTPPNPYCSSNPIIAGGATVFHDQGPNHGDGYFTYLKPNDWFVSRCRMAQALDAFLFFAMFAFLASTILDVLATRRKQRNAV